MILEWLAGSAAKAVFGIFGDTIVKPFVEIYAKKKDVDLEKFKTQSQENQVLGMAVIQAEVERVKGNTSLILAGMNHPVWWVAWLLFVLPVGFYHAMIHLVSVYPDGLTLFWIWEILEPGQVVKRVPATQESWDLWIVLSIFGAQTTTGAITAMAKKYAKP